MTSAEPANWSSGRVLFVSSAFGTPRHRCEIPIEGLAKVGVAGDYVQADDLEISTRDTTGMDRLQRYSHIVLNRVPASAWVERILSYLSRSETKVLFDIDDLLFDPELLARLPFVRLRSSEDRKRLLDASAGIRKIMAHCRGVLCSTSQLARETSALNRVAVVLNSVSDQLIRLSIVASEGIRRNPNATTVGFLCGHVGHRGNFDLVRAPLAQLLRDNQSLRLRCVGLIEEPGPLLERFEDRIDLLPYVPWTALPAEIATMDICLAPLVADRFSECKSDLRYLEAALCGVPLVASPVGQTAESITDGVNGFLAGSPEDWIDRVQSLISEPERRREMGEAARHDVLTNRRTRQMGNSLLQAFDQLG